MCKIPCSECDKYLKCKTFSKTNRCLICKHCHEDVLKSSCTKCRGFSLVNKSCVDLFEHI